MEFETVIKNLKERIKQVKKNINLYYQARGEFNFKELEVLKNIRRKLYLTLRTAIFLKNKGVNQGELNFIIENLQNGIFTANKTDEEEE